MTSNKDDQKKKARELFEGDSLCYTMSDVAKELGIKYTTVKMYAWQDKRDGKPWKRKPNEQNPNPQGMQKREEYKDSILLKRLLVEEIDRDIFCNTELSEQEKIFCFEYLKHYNATVAAKNAGYKAAGNVMGYVILQRPRVQKALEDLSQRMCTRLKIQTEKIIERHAQIAFADIKDYVDWGIKEISIPIFDKNSGEQVDEEIQEIEYLNVKKPDEVDGTMISKIHRDKFGLHIEIEDRSKSLMALTNLMLLTKGQETLNRFNEKKIQLEELKIKNETKPTVKLIAEFIKALSDEDSQELMNELASK